MLNSHSNKNIFIMSIIYACGFALIETMTRQFTYYVLNHANIHPYTTPQQFILTFMWTPLILLHKNIDNSIVRCLTYPLNIYMCEIIGGYVLLHMFNYRAWYYDDKYALFNGTITLLYYPLWIMLYCIENVGYNYIINKIK